MSNVANYWTFVRIDAGGNLKREAISTAQAFIQRLFTEDESDREIQTTLNQIWHSPHPDRPLAELCLRCFISHQIEQACLEITRLFGSGHFQITDLLPLVFSDTRWKQPFPASDAPYQPHSARILRSFDPDKSSLSNWTRRLIERDPEVEDFLLKCGIYRRSDWTILKDTTVGGLRHNLASLLPPSELAEATALLKAYQSIYSGDRISQLQTGQKCLPPTESQLQRMAALLPVPPSSHRLLSDLQTLAKQLRQAKTQPAEPLDLDRSDQQPAPSSTDSPDILLSRYLRELIDCLDQAINQTIDQRLENYRKKKAPTDELFLRVLKLFYCDCQSMGEIAQQFEEFQQQYHVTRLLKLKELYADVRRNAIEKMRRHEQLQAEIAEYMNQARLDSLDQRLEDVLDQIVEAARKEATSPHRSNQSLWSNRLCHCLCCRQS